MSFNIVWFRCACGKLHAAQGVTSISRCPRCSANLQVQLFESAGRVAQNVERNRNKEKNAKR